MNARTTRRNFIAGAGVAAAALSAGAGLALADEAGTASGCTFADTVAWDGEYDVVVMGMGFAGMTAALAAARTGAATLVFDVAPEWEAGGNSRYCAQGMIVSNDKEQTLEHYKGLYADRPYEYDLETIEVFVDAMYDAKQIFIDEYGADPNILSVTFGSAAEYPDNPGAESLGIMFAGGSWFNAGAHHLLRTNLFAQDNLDIWFNARGTELVQDPETKTVVGIEIEKDGETRRIRALNGVVLCSGGFENNEEMVGCYLDRDSVRPMGTLWNRGDGILMAQRAGAQLWHMGNWCTAHQFCYAVDTDPEYGEHAMGPQGHQCFNTGLEQGSFIVAGKDGSRFTDETGEHRHGRKYTCGEWKIPHTSGHGFIVMDNANFEEMDANPYPWLPGVLECMVEADTIEELAEKTGCDPEILTATVETFNNDCEQGVDTKFGRDPETMRALVEPPFHAIPMVTTMLNTQGGPRHNARGEILDMDGNPIPHLYGAGEMGSIAGKNYQGGANAYESAAFGRIAGACAAEAKDPLPQIDAEPVASNIIYTVGSGSTELPAERTYELAENQAVGTGMSIGGDIDVIITVDENGTITDCQVVYEHETKGLGDLAVEEMPKRIIEAGSPNVDMVASATMASAAIRVAAMDALSQLGY